MEFAGARIERCAALATAACTKGDTLELPLRYVPRLACEVFLVGGVCCCLAPTRSSGRKDVSTTVGVMSGHTKCICCDGRPE